MTEKGGCTADILAGKTKPILERKIKTAILTCQNRIRKNPEDAIAYYLLGRIHVVEKNYGSAEEAFKKSIDIRPLWQPPHNAWARLYINQEKSAEAIEKLKSSEDHDFESSSSVVPNRKERRLTITDKVFIKDGEKSYPSISIIRTRST